MARHEHWLLLYPHAQADKSKVDALYECCNAFYRERGDDARCVSCPKPDLLRYIIICQRKSVF